MVFVAVVHHISWAMARAGPSKHVGGLMGTVDVVVVVASSTPHLMGSGPGRPVKTHGPPHGPGGAAHIEPKSHGPRPGPVHQISRGWAAARPGPSIFQKSRSGPDKRPMTSPDYFFVVPSSFFITQSQPSTTINFDFPSTGDSQPCDGPPSKQYHFWCGYRH